VESDNLINNVTFTVVVNGGNTALSCTIGASANRCSDLTHTVAIASGATFAVLMSNTPGTPVHFRVRYH
jgi:hypothetical protein